MRRHKVGQAKKMNVALREERGKNESRRLKDAGFIPAVLYSHGKAESIKFLAKDFKGLFSHGISESVIFDIVITDRQEEQMAFVKDYQMDGMTGEIMHVDLFRVTKGEKIHTQVHVELTGTPKGLKAGGILEIGERILDVRCLPAELPEKIIVDVSGLEIGHSIHVKDLNLAKGVEILTNPDTVIVSVHLPRTAAEPAEEAATAEGGSANEPAEQS